MDSEVGDMRTWWNEVKRQSQPERTQWFSDIGNEKTLL